MQRGPVSIGLHAPLPGQVPQLVAHIDPSDPRVQEKEGERLFEDNGEQSAYLQRLKG